MALSRREMILAGSAVLAGPLLAQRAAAQPSLKQLRFLTTEPRNGQPELEQLVQNWLTPTRHFYVRSHAPNPQIEASQFRLQVEGMVRRPLSLSLAELNQAAQHTATVTLTCAGNRRTEFNAEGKIGGVQWGSGAIGNATWTGSLLADVLRKAELTAGAKHVWFEGLDEIPRGTGVIAFGASIPIEKAMTEQGRGAPLLVTKMNGDPLSPDHGYPLRMVVPGYIGARSVKWLGRIVVSDRPSPNHYVASAYKVVKETEAIDWAEAAPIYRYPINAAICTPAPNSRVEPGRLEVSGYALASGRPGSRIQDVSLSTDGGRTWTAARLQSSANDFCWQLWKAHVRVGPNTDEVILKATDTVGQFMPARVPWNAKGYLQNSWYRLPLQVG